MISMVQLATRPFIHAAFTQGGNPYDLTNKQLKSHFASKNTSQEFDQYGVWNYTSAEDGTAYYSWSSWDTMTVDDYTMTVTITDIYTEESVTTAGVDVSVVADPGTTTEFTIS